jgi:hypothetical protein
MNTKRYIVIAESKKVNPIVFVIFAASDFRAETKAKREGLKYEGFTITYMRQIYNPLFDPSSSLYGGEIPVPQEVIENYKYWDESGTGDNFFVLD